MKLTKSAAVKNLKANQKRLSTGHYLDRALALAESIENKDHVELIKALIKLTESHGCRVDGTTEILNDLASTSIYILSKKLDLNKEQLKPLAWAVDYFILKNYDLLSLR